MCVPYLSYCIKMHPKKSQPVLILKISKTGFCTFFKVFKLPSWRRSAPIKLMGADELHWNNHGDLILPKLQVCCLNQQHCLLHCVIENSSVYEVVIKLCRRIRRDRPNHNYIWEQHHMAFFGFACFNICLLDSCSSQKLFMASDLLRRSSSSRIYKHIVPYNLQNSAILRSHRVVCLKV